MNHHIETLVIGGGAVGVCCAYYLQALGKKVTLVEKDDICAGSSYGNAGLIVPSHSIPLAAPGVIVQGLKWMFNPESPFFIKPRFQKDLLSWLWKFRGSCNQQHVRRSIPLMRDLSLASLGLFEELAALKGVDFGLEKKGKLEIFRTASGFEEAVSEIALLQEYGLNNQELVGEELNKSMGGLPNNAVGGIFYPLDAHLIPDRFVHQLARFIEQQGVHLLNFTEVISFETSGHRITKIETTRGDIRVGEVVLAAGCWTVDLARELNIRLMIEPAKGYSLTYKRPVGWPDIPLMMSEAKVAVTPMEDTLRFAGTLELAGFDLSINRRRLKAILKAVPAYFPAIDPDALELIEIWRGLRPCSPDGLPYLGRPRNYDNVIIAAGHGMLGISLAPVTGKIVSQLASDQAAEVDIAALRIERFD
jgi:D-amino-acid dehydrogenase